MKKNHEETRGDHEETREEDLWRRTHEGEIIEPSGSIRQAPGSHLPPRKHPGDTNEAPRRHPGNIWEDSGGTHEALRKDAGGTQDASLGLGRWHLKASRKQPAAPRK